MRPSIQELEEKLAAEANMKRAVERDLDEAYQTQGMCGSAAPLYIAVVDQLRQLTSPVWDGNLIGKTQRDHLVKQGLVGRAMGWNFLSEKGVETCIALGILRA